MKTDFYTKTVLTIIAVCLSIIVVKGVLIGATKNPEIGKYGLIPLNPDGTISVSLKEGEMLDVNLVEVDGFPVRNNKGKLIM